MVCRYVPKRIIEQREGQIGDYLGAMNQCVKRRKLPMWRRSLLRRAAARVARAFLLAASKDGLYQGTASAMSKRPRRLTPLGAGFDLPVAHGTTVSAPLRNGIKRMIG